MFVEAINEQIANGQLIKALQRAKSFIGIFTCQIVGMIAFVTACEQGILISYVLKNIMRLAEANNLMRIKIQALQLITVYGYFQ